MRRRFGLGRSLERDALGIGLIIAGLDNSDFEECQRLQPPRVAASACNCYESGKGPRSSRKGCAPFEMSLAVRQLTKNLACPIRPFR